MLHVPADRVQEVSALVTEAAAAATGLLFGRIPLEFPVVAVTVDSHAAAK